MPHKETKKQRDARKPEDQKERDLISEVTDFITESEAADSDERQLFVDDLDFVYSEHGQWDQATLNRRSGRPSYTFNRVLGAVNQVIGEQRLNTATIKVRPTDDVADPDTADVFAGMIRNIEGVSTAQSTYDMAFKDAVAGGYGGWRVVTEFQGDKSFNQEIRIKPIYNILTVFWDPLSFDPVKRDQTRCVIAERVSKEFYEAKYGDNPDDIKVSRDSRGWVDEKGVRVAEFFKLIPHKKEIALMSDGRIVDFDDDLKKIQDELENVEGAPVVEKTRTVDTFQVHWWKVDGSKILEGPIVYDWRFIPVVKLPGRYINIEGKQKTQSLTRHAKDAQKVYNYDRTTMSEVVANAPRQPYLVTAAMIKGYEKQWNQSGAANKPYLMFNPDSKAPAGAAAPQRVPNAEVPQALITLAAQDVDDIKSTTGFFDASLGRQANEISGTAIKGRARQADVGSYEFFDNYRKAIQYTGDILLDMIPRVYDTERVVRIIGLDGQEDFKKINAYDDATNKKIDLSTGLYDTTVDIGPAFSTQREESFNTLLQAAEVMPVVSEIAPDLIMGALDVPGGDEIVARIRKRLIEAKVVEPSDEELEAMGPQEPPPPNPVEDALVKGEEAKAALNASKVDKTVAETEEIKVDTAIKVAEAPVKGKQLQTNLISSTLKPLQGSNNE